ncbi:LIM domain only protein 7 [Liparis tanakae]|uniref:LIM domain only protein 7 n=1 Tax=Liparis tanakae TaxID=230148 RepID=A0A4Z2FUW2_9TELE|nr:LIM domain only protein 7 [Liparis tanakae]
MCESGRSDVIGPKIQRAARRVDCVSLGVAWAWRGGESLDNLDASYNSWRSSWTPRGNAYARPNSALFGATGFYGGGSTAAGGVQRPVSSALPSSYSMGSLRAGVGAHPPSSSSSSSSSPWCRQQSPSPSPSPSSPSVSGRKVCTFCDTPLGKGAAMIIESLGLCYHLTCFKCIDCKSDLGGSAAGAEPASQPPCDVTVLQQIDEESTSDNNPSSEALTTFTRSCTDASLIPELSVTPTRPRSGRLREKLQVIMSNFN